MGILKGPVEKKRRKKGEEESKGIERDSGEEGSGIKK